MSERMNGTREREPDEEEEAKSEWELKYDKDVYKFDKLLMNNNIEAVRELLATNWTLLNKYSKNSNLYYNIYQVLNNNFFYFWTNARFVYSYTQALNTIVPWFKLSTFTQILFYI